jgi:predicted ATPase
MSSSIVIEEDQIRFNKKRVATANLAQNKSKVHRVSEKKVQKYFLICESCFWCASYCEELSSRSQDMIIQNTSYPACGTDKCIECLPISFNKSEKPSTGGSFH